MTETNTQGRTLSRWLKIKPAEVLFSKSMFGIAWFGIALGALLPPGARDFPICFLRAQTGIPCLGCGLTRSLSHAFRGDFATSWTYHPFGIVIAILLVVCAAISLLPSQWRKELKRLVNGFPVTFFTFLILGLTTFIGFGITRAVQHVFVH